MVAMKAQMFQVSCWVGAGWSVAAPGSYYSNAKLNGWRQVGLKKAAHSHGQVLFENIHLGKWSPPPETASYKLICHQEQQNHMLRLVPGQTAAGRQHQPCDSNSIFDHLHMWARRCHSIMKFVDLWLSVEAASRTPKYIWLSNLD